MSGSETVRAFRRRFAKSEQKPAIWRKPAVLAAIGVIVGGFGSIMVQAGDNAGVYDIARQYTTARGTPRLQLPQIFAPAPRPIVRTSLSYAPTTVNLAAPLQTTGKRAVDRQRRDDRHGSALSKTLKINPDPSKSAYDDGDFQSAYLRSRTSYCVRSCDGFYFPIGNTDSGGSAAHDAACTRACPGADVSVFVAPAGGKGIEDAYNRRGQRYQATQTAFNYRTQLDAACTCNPAGAKRKYSVLDDFTLRAGDLVMSRDGLKVFRGTESFPYRSAHFGKASSEKMSARERRWMQMADGSAAPRMSGRSAEPLQARIAAQIGSARGTDPRTIGLRGVESTIALSDGRKMRYVGPHEWRGEQR